MREAKTDLLIIGAGPAGLAAALAAAAAGVARIVVIDRLPEPGGILPQCIHNGFGLHYFGAELTGPEYAWRLLEKLRKLPQVSIRTQTMTVDLTSKRQVFTVSPTDGMVAWRPRAVILAMGCRERPRGALNIPGSRPAGIYTAGTIQRLMNIEGYLPGKKAVILGSGDIGLIVARRLSLEGIQVRAVLEILPYSNGLARNIVQCLEDYQIPLMLSHTVTRISGERRIEAVEVAPVDQNQKPMQNKAVRFDCDTLVLSVGLIPENELSQRAGIELDPATGGPSVDSNYQTSLPGIFACGNAVFVHDLADDASLEGEIAGNRAAQWVMGKLPGQSIRRVKMAGNLRAVVPQLVAGDHPLTFYMRVLGPGRAQLLRVGNGMVRHAAVTPGETIRYLANPDDLYGFKDDLPITMEKD